MRLLLVEDDALLGDGIQEGLTDAGFVTDWLQDGESARLALMTETSFDGVVLDIGLPRLDGLQLLAWIRRERSHLPVLLLTARDSIEDRIKGLDAGADDYLIKPFALGELCARVRALVRQGKGRHDGELCWQDLILDPVHQSVQQAGQTLNLTAMEYRLLHLLMANHPHYLSRPQLEEKLYGWQQDIESNTLDEMCIRDSIMGVSAFANQKKKFIVLRPSFDQLMTRLAAKGREIYRRGWIGANHMQHFTTLHRGKGFFSPQDRQRAIEPT